MASVPNMLLEILDELVLKELKRFKWHLTQQVLEGFRSIPKGQLENDGTHDTVDKMIAAYMDSGAVKITLEILKRMGQNNLAQRLNNTFEDVYRPLPVAAQLPRPSSSMEEDDEMDDFLTMLMKKRDTGQEQIDQALKKVDQMMADL